MGIITELNFIFAVVSVLTDRFLTILSNLPRLRTSAIFNDTRVFHTPTKEKTVLKIVFDLTYRIG